MTRSPTVSPRLEPRLAEEFLAHSVALLDYPVRQDAAIQDAAALRLVRPEAPRDPDLPLLAPKTYPRPEVSVIEATSHLLVPPPLVEGFVGRRTELDGAVNTLLSGRPVLFTGATGTGKTALLRQIANDPRLLKSFKQVWWLDTLENAGITLGLALNAPGVLRSPVENQPQLIRDYMISSGILLVVDRAAPDEVQAAIAFAPAIAISSPHWEGTAAVSHFPLEGLPTDAGTELLMRLSSQPDNVARPLGAAVEYRPSALRILAALIVEDGMTPAALTDFLQSAPGDQLTALYSMSYDALPDDYQALCRAFAASPQQWIGVDTILAGYDKPLVGQRALTFLEKHGFIERFDNAVRVAGNWTQSILPAETGFKAVVHPVTRFLARGSSEASAQGQALHSQGIVWMEEGNDERAEAALSEALSLRLEQDTDHAVAETLTALARLAYLRGEDATAIRRLEEAAQHLHTLRDDESLETVRIALSRAYRRAGRLDAALSVLGENASLEDLASIYRAREDWDAAIKTYQEWRETEPLAAIPLAETLIAAGRFTEALAILSINDSWNSDWLRAQMFHIQGDLTQALALYKKGRSNVPQANRPEFARAYGRALAATEQAHDAALLVGAEGIWFEAKLPRPIFARQRASHALSGYFHLMAGELDEAEESAQHALNVEGEQVDPLYDAIAHCTLAQLAWRRGDLDSALASFDRELTARETLHPRDDHEIGVVLHNIADVQCDRGEHERAIANYRRALTHKDVVRDYRSVLLSRLALRAALVQTGRKPDALEAGQQAVELVTQRSNVDLQPLGYVLATQAIALQAIDRLPRVEQLLAEWTTRLAQRFEEAVTHPNWAIRALAIGLYLRSLPVGVGNESAENQNLWLELARQALLLCEANAPDTNIEFAARRDLGNIYLQLERWQDASDILKPLVAAVPPMPVALDPVTALAARLGLARADVHLGDIDEASQYYEEALAFEPNAHERGLILRDVAEMYRAVGQDEPAAKAYVRALEILNKDLVPSLYIDTVVSLAYTRLRLRNFNDAIDTFEQALAFVEALPDADKALMPSVLYDMASAHYTLGQYRRAAATYKRAMAYLDPKLDASRAVDMLTALARSYVELGAFQQALEAYHDSLQLDGIAPARRRAILAEQAEVFIQIGLVQSAIDTYRAALALEGATSVDLAALHRGLGTLYAQLDLHPKAQKHFESALAAVQDERTGATLRALGDVYRAQGQLDDAISTYNRAIEQLDRAENAVDFAATQRALGQVYLNLDNPEEALIHLAIALEIERALPQQDGGRIVNTLASLSRAHEMGGDLDAATRRRHEALVYQDVRYSPEGYVDTLAELGRLYVLQHKLEDAAKAYEEALGTEANLPTPDSDKVSDMTNGLADVYRAQGKLEAAAKLYRQVVAVMNAQAEAVAASPPLPDELQVDRVAQSLQVTESDISRHVQTLNAAEQSWLLLNRAAKTDLKSLAFVRALQAQTCAALGRWDDSEHYLDLLMELLNERRDEVQLDDPRSVMRALAMLLQGQEHEDARQFDSAQENYQHSLDIAEHDVKTDAALVWAIRQKAGRAGTKSG